MEPGSVRRSSDRAVAMMNRRVTVATPRSHLSPDVVSLSKPWFALQQHASVLIRSYEFTLSEARFSQGEARTDRLRTEL
jgi:hypothetical protein